MLLFIMVDSLQDPKYMTDLQNLLVGLTLIQGYFIYTLKIYYSTQDIYSALYIRVSKIFCSVYSNTLPWVVFAV